MRTAAAAGAALVLALALALAAGCQRKQAPEAPPVPFCDQLLARADVEALLGLSLPDAIPDGARAAQMARCARRNAHQQVWAMVDCTPSAADVAVTREALQAVAPAPEHYREVSIGRGGGHVVRGTNPMMYQLAFVHASLPCLITVGTTGVDRDVTEPLAGHVGQKLTKANAPLR